MALLTPQAKSPVRRKAIILVVLVFCIGMLLFQAYQENQKRQYQQQFFIAATATVQDKAQVKSDKWYEFEKTVYTLVFDGLDGKHITRFNVRLDKPLNKGDRVEIFYNPSQMGDAIVLKD